MSDKSTHPRPEYPRPDFQRGTIEGRDWLNLNGPWQFRFDPDRRGQEENWFQPGPQDWREQIIVPFCWESLAAWGEAEAAGNENYYSTRAFRNPLEVDRSNHSYVDRYEVGWYRRRVALPTGEAWDGKRLILKIGAADFFTDCWCNGQHVGRHEGGYTPFEFDLTAAATSPESPGEILLVLRVEDPMNNSEQPVGKQWHWYTSTSGIWQTVYLEPREPAYIESFRVATDIDASTATFEIETREAPAESEVVLYLFPPGGEAQVLRAPVIEGRARAEARLPHPYLWTPEQPHLYRVVLKLQRKDSPFDTVRSYFGMRKIDSGPAEDPKAPAVLRLNNTPIYLRGALYQSYHPDGVYTAGDADVLRRDVLWARQFGFNFLRVHIKIDDPMLLYYADTLGIMLMCDFPNFGEGGNTDLGRRRFEEMMRAAIRRDFNHPSIFAWCVFNETWGFGGQVELIKHFPSVKGRALPKKPAGEMRPPGGPPTPGPAEGRSAKIANASAHEWVQRMWDLTKKLDPTRLVEDMSVVQWEHLDYFGHGDTDINSWHFYLDDYQRAKDHIENVVGATFAGSTFNYVPGFQQRTQPLINSEYGGVGALDGDRDVSWSFKFLTNELRRHGAISAYIYTELHDVEWEYNGFLNYDRTPKDFGYDPRIINEADTLPINAAPIARAQPGQVVRVEIASSHYSVRAQGNVTLRWRLGGMDTWGKLHQDLAGGMIPIAFPHRRVAHAHTIELQLPSRPMLCRLDVEALDAEGRLLAENYIQYFVGPGDLARREVTDRTQLLRASIGEWSASQWSGPSSSPETAAQEGICFGQGHGFFEWSFPTDGIDLRRTRRLRVLCEVSSRRADSPQTDDDHYPTSLQINLNEVPVLRQILVNHPHDTRGALSYLRGGRGAYGYLVSTLIEGDLLRRILDAAPNGPVRLRCQVPVDVLAAGGLTIYGLDAGRYPVAPTLLLDW